jgi:hypothetical protein
MPEPRPTTWTVDEALSIGESYRETARRAFLAEGQHAPIYFLLATQRPSFPVEGMLPTWDTGGEGRGIMPIDLRFATASQERKAAATRAIQALARATVSVGSLFVSEVWMVIAAVSEGENARDKLKAFSRTWAGRLAENPERSECLLFQIEHVRKGHCSWIARISRTHPEDTSPTLGPWMSFEEAHGQAAPGTVPTWSEVGGQFTHLLPGADVKGVV